MVIQATRASRGPSTEFSTENGPGVRARRGRLRAGGDCEPGGRSASRECGGRRAAGGRAREHAGLRGGTAELAARGASLL